MASFWNALTGKSRKTTEDNAPADSGDIAPTTTFAAPAFDPSTAADVSAFLKPVGTAGFDPSALHPLAGLGSDLTYLDVDDAALSAIPGGQSLLPSRGWSDDLCYGTGATYLVGLSLGGAWGFVEGLRKVAPEAPPRLKLNGILNAVTRRGPFLGNSAGVVAMVYNGINSTIGYYRGKHDTANSVLSGAIAGAIFKSTRGVKPMAISAGIVGSLAGAWSVGSKALI
jgi:import inner membrane translocase subunit TIM23